jgi:hypothetical protein
MSPISPAGDNRACRYGAGRPWPLRGGAPDQRLGRAFTARRRWPLLGIDTDGDLVIVELKRDRTALPRA